MTETEKWWQQLTSTIKHTPEYKAEAISIDLAMQINSRMSEIGISSKDLSERLRVSKSYISQIMQGQTNMTILTLCKISHAIDSELNITIASKLNIDHIFKVPIYSTTASEYNCEDTIQKSKGKVITTDQYYNYSEDYHGIAAGQ